MKRISRLLHPQCSGGIWAPFLAAAFLMASAALVLAAWHVNPNSSPAEQADKPAESSWQKWLNEDVVYIISDQERTAFKNLKTDEERQHFEEAFWRRRNPTPGSAENSFKKEHYRRIAYANSHFSVGILPGWRTDRGRVYILYGPPDEIDAHLSGGSYERPASEGGGTVLTFPFEDWRYAHFEGIGSLTVEFVDPSSSGEFHMTLDPKAKYRKL